MSYYTPLNYPAFLAISNATLQTANVTITLYNGGDTISVSASVAPGGLYKYDFSNATTIKTIENPRGSAGSVVKYGTHISSDVPVTAYYMMNSKDSKDIFTLKGRQALGTEFYVPMQSDNAAKSSGTYQGLDQIDIVAAQDVTTVTVIPKASVVNTSGSGSNPLPAGTSIVRTLNRGETLKIMESGYDLSPSLAGTKITSDKPIAVTVTEDLVQGDTSGDQIVPINSLGTRYIVPKGYRTNTPTDRIYLVGTEAGTTVDIYATAGSTTPTQTIALTAGQAQRYDFLSTVNALYVESDKPVYVYHRSGSGEEGAALLPSVYAIGQTQMSFYQVSALLQKGFLVFRTGTENSFRIRYGSENFAALSLTPLDIPNVTDWKVARFDFAAAPSDGQVVTVESTQSAFSLGYITGAVASNNSYGYFSSYGTFEFTDTTWMCGSSVTIQGGYALSYEWTFEGEVISTEPSITVTQEGEYTLVMDQDPNIVTAITIVRRVNAGTICPDTLVCPGTSPHLSVSGASGDIFQWQTRSDLNAQWEDIPGATLPACTPAPLYQPAYYRRGTSASQCAMEYSGSVEVQISRPCVLPVNPHLMTRFNE